MASNGSFNTSAYINRSLEFSWSLQSQSIADNTSTIAWTLKGSGSAAGYVKCGGFRVVIDGAVVYDQPTDYRVDVYSGTAIASGTYTIQHTANGTRSFSASVQGAVYFYDVNVYGSSTWSLDAIPRQAVILTAPNFTDIDNPTITYRNDAGSALTSLKACISLTGADDIKYRDVPVNGSSYTFELTEAERNVLRYQTINTKTATATFYITSVIAGQTYYSTIKRILTIVDDEPGLSVSLTDSNATTAALTGNSNSFIRYYSKPSFVMTASPQKGSSIRSYRAVNGGQVISAASGSFDSAINNTFDFSVVDSRGNTTTQKITRTLVEYIKLTCHLNLEAPDIDGNLKFTISGNYFMGSFGATSNSLNVQYRYKVNDGAYGEWTTAGIVANGHTYQATVSMTDLSYQNKYTFQARAIDKIATVLSDEYAVRTQPIFDWSADDFNFNVPVKIQGNLLSDFIVEQGKSGIWTYRKWYSGIMECWGWHETSGINIAANNYSGYYYSNNVEVPLPAGFTAITDYQVNGGSFSEMNFVRTFGIDNSTARYRVVGHQATTNAAVSVYLSVKGTWK